MGGLVSSVANIFTGANDTREAANLSAEQQRIAAQAAAFRPIGMTTRFGTSQFTRAVDPTTGMPYVSSAGYTAAPELAGLQERLFGGFGQGLTSAEQYGAQFAPLQGGAANLFGLAQQLTPTSVDRSVSPEAQALAQRYQQAALGLAPTSYETTASPEAQAYANQLRSVASQVMPTSYDPTAEAQRITQQQQGLLAGGREQQLANIRNNLFQSGRAGLATGGTSTGLQATNPEMAAYYNALAQSDAQIAANAQQQARANLQSDIGLAQGLGGAALSTQQTAEQLAQSNMLNRLGLSLGYGTQGLGTTTGAQQLARQYLTEDLGQVGSLYTTGAGLLGTQLQGLSSAYNPLQTQLGLSSTVEGMAQLPYQLGMQIGTASQPGQTAYQQGLSQAAQTQYQGAAAANAANAGFWSGLMTGGANAYGAYKR